MISSMKPIGHGVEVGAYVPIRILICLFVCFLTTFSAVHAEGVTITPDVVYGHKFGLAMTFDVFSPQNEPNGAAVLHMVSGGWNSKWTPPEQSLDKFQPLTDKGFTVFAVRHGSSPKFSIVEAVADVKHSVRFIRMHADEFSIDPNRIGVFGGSAGGHLSLMLGTTADDGDVKAKDLVARTSGRVQAVVAYIAPTDLRVMAKDAPDRLAIYDIFPALEINQEVATSLSPLLFVTPDDAPTLLVVGMKDTLVPLFHNRNIHAAFEKAGVKSDLIEFPGSGHGFRGDAAKQATEAMVAWFEKYL